MLVLGAGPAGAAAAFFLSHLSAGKLNVLSLEKLDRNFGRYHRMCGEAISERAFRELAPLSPEHVTHRIRRAVEHWPGGVRIETGADGYILDRPAFLRDVLDLAQKEGCHREVGSAVRVSRGDRGYIVETRDGRAFSAEWLVGADGWNSLVRRTFFQGSPRLLWAEQYVLPGSTEPDTMHFHYDERYLGGYRWVFPHPSGMRVGFTRGAEEHPQALERHGRPIPYGYSQVVNGRACLVGDAAGQANPITFGGIRIGMMAGRMAAESIVHGGLEGYAERWPSSPFASPVYVKAFDALQGMDNDALYRSVRPFRKGYGTIAGMRALFGGRRNRLLYRAYGMGAKWGW